MKKMTQAKIVEMLRQILGRGNVIVINAGAGNAIGITDTLINIKGRSYFLEIKILPDKLSAMQLLFRKRFFDCTGTLEYSPLQNKFVVMRDIRISKKSDAIFNDICLKLNERLNAKKL